MKIELTTGCTLDSLTINEMPYEKLNNLQVRSKIIELLEHFEDKDLYDEIIRDIVYAKGTCKDGYKCEQCGDYIETYELSI